MAPAQSFHHSRIKSLGADRSPINAVLGKDSQLFGSDFGWSELDRPLTAFLQSGTANKTAQALKLIGRENTHTHRGSSANEDGRKRSITREAQDFTLEPSKKTLDSLFAWSLLVKCAKVTCGGTEGHMRIQSQGGNV